MWLAKLRRSVALIICPELGPRPARAGYDGTAKPIERAALDAARVEFLAEESKRAHGHGAADRLLASDRMTRDWFRGVDAQPNPAATEATLHQAGSPKWRAYQVAVPKEWRALQPVFYPVPGENDQSEPQDTLAVLRAGWRRFQAGVLLCRPGTDGRAAVQEFEACASLEGAFLGQDGQYLQAAQDRPAFAVVPLEGPSPNHLDQNRSDECLVLLPLIDPSPGASRDSVPPLMMFVNGMRVEWGAK